MFLFSGEGLNGSERDKRLRPERPKKENPDFDYEFSLVPEDLVERIKTEQMPCPLPQQNVVNLENVQEKQINLPQVEEVSTTNIILFLMVVRNSSEIQRKVVRVVCSDSWLNTHQISDAVTKGPGY